MARNYEEGTDASNRFAKALMLLAVIGALNWGLVGIFNWNLVDAIFGGGVHEETSMASRLVYALVGIAGLASLFLLPKAGHGTLRTHARGRAT